MFPGEPSLQIDTFPESSSHVMGKGQLRVDRKLQITLSKIAIRDKTALSKLDKELDRITLPRRTLVLLDILDSVAMLTSLSQSFVPLPSVSAQRAPRNARFAVRAEAATVAAPINPNIQKDNPKVVDTVTTDSVEKQVGGNAWSSKACWLLPYSTYLLTVLCFVRWLSGRLLPMLAQWQGA